MILLLPITYLTMFYLIPGLGADERVFQNLQPLLRGKTQVLHWLTPEPNETLPHYAARMSVDIPLEQPGLLIGVSFGGMVGLEISRLRPQLRTVLISSIPDASALPPLLKLIRSTRVYQLVPPHALKLFPRAGQWYFGVRNGPEYRLFKQILRDMEPTYTRWAIHRLLHWDSTSVGRSIQILGTHDRVFPAGPAPVDFLIQGGGHFMAFSHAPEISEILNKLLVEQVSTQTH